MVTSCFNGGGGSSRARTRRSSLNVISGRGGEFIKDVRFKKHSPAKRSFIRSFFFSICGRVHLSKVKFDYVHYHVFVFPSFVFLLSRQWFSVCLTLTCFGRATAFFKLRQNISRSDKQKTLYPSKFLYFNINLMFFFYYKYDK